MPSQYTQVGSPPRVHAVYTLCAGPVHADGLLGTALLAEGPQGVGIPGNNVLKEAKREVSGRNGAFHRAIP